MVKSCGSDGTVKEESLKNQAASANLVDVAPSMMMGADSCRPVTKLDDNDIVSPAVHGEHAVGRTKPCSVTPIILKPAPKKSNRPDWSKPAEVRNPPVTVIGSAWARAGSEQMAAMAAACSIRRRMSVMRSPSARRTSKKQDLSVLPADFA